MAYRRAECAMGVNGAVEVFALADLLQRPELLRPPPVVVPLFAWQGRLTMLAGAEKVGKSTVIGQAVAAVSQGEDFLGQRVAAVNVLYLDLDESVSDLVRRLHRHGARDRVYVVRERPGMEELIGLINSHQIGLVVIDTVGEFVTGLVDDFNSAAQWTPILKALRAAMEETGCAGVFLHHTVRGGKRYADSRALGAGVDVILTMCSEDDDTSVRKVKALGRLEVADFRLRFDGRQYDVADGAEAAEVTLQARLCRAIASDPGIGKGKLRAAVGGGTAAADAALEFLLRDGVVEDRGNEKARAYHLVPLVAGDKGRVKVEVNRDRDEVTHESQRESDEGQGVSQAPLTGSFIPRDSQGPTPTIAAGTTGCSGADTGAAAYELGDPYEPEAVT
jgi:hypothetical protein